MKTVYALARQLQSSITRSFILCLLGIFAGAHTFAADLLVEPNGAAGTYATITAALSAAAAGDRILVYPVPGYAYNEALTLTKNVTIQSALQGQRFSLNGMVTVGNMVGSISGAIITPPAPYVAVYQNATSSTASIRIINCILNSAAAGSTTASIYLDHDTIDAKDGNWGVWISRGRVSGCVLNNLQGGIIIPKSGIVTNDTVMIVGNTLNMNHNTTPFGTNGFWLRNPNQFVFISNNYITYKVTDYEPTNQGSAILIDSLKSAPGIYNAIINNTYYGYIAVTFLGGEAADLSGITCKQPAGLLDIENNLFKFSFSIPKAFAGNLASFNSVIVNYNYSSTAATLGLGGTNQFNYSDSMAINAQGYPVVTGPAGNPNYAYLNPDLTTNTPGVFGGPYSLKNFQADFGQNAAVLFMQAPKVVLVNHPFNISADGFAR